MLRLNWAFLRIDFLILFSIINLCSPDARTFRKRYSMVKKMFIAGVVILSLFGLSSVAKADTRDVTFHLDNSLAGSTFFHQNVIVSNLFDAVPFYNILQQWRGASTRG
jgi:hypothetical protein